MKLEEIVAEASKLSEEERASLASQLLHGLETPVYSVSDEEVRRRMREADEDPSAPFASRRNHRLPQRAPITLAIPWPMACS